MSGNLQALAEVWVTLPAGSTSEKLALLNTKMVSGPARDVRRSEIRKILTATGAMPKMQAYVANPAAAQQPPCLLATNYLIALVTYEATITDTLQTSDPVNLNNIEGMVPNLLLEPVNGLTQEIMGAIMALITPNVLWWQANGFSGPVLISDLIAAGNLF